MKLIGIIIHNQIQTRDSCNTDPLVITERKNTCNYILVTIQVQIPSPYRAGKFTELVKMKTIYSSDMFKGKGICTGV